MTVNALSQIAKPVWKSCLLFKALVALGLFGVCVCVCVCASPYAHMLLWMCSCYLGAGHLLQGRSRWRGWRKCVWWWNSLL